MIEFMPLEELFVQIGVVIVVAAALSFLLHRLRQPLIIAYILTGILVGPSFLNITHASEFFSVLADLGIAFLLFTVGLNLDWKHIKEVGWIALATGLGQVVFTTGIGFLLGRLLGFDPVISFYIAIAFTFSSTIIVVKLLSDKEDLDRLYGRIAVGFLLVQDLIAMFVLLLLSALKSGGDPTTVLTLAFGKWAIAVLVMIMLSLWVLPKLTAYAARSQELLFLFGLAWCFGSAAVLSSMGFGIELGALLAGITLAGTPWSKELAARIRPLRDFFLIIFFIILGTQLSVGVVTTLWLPALVFSAFILIGNPMIVMLILRLLGYHPRTGFLAGTTVAQVSEFSFILLAAGMTMGHLPPTVLTLATLVGIVTIAISSYVITYNDQIYNFFIPLFRFLEPTRFSQMLTKTAEMRPQVILFGYHRMGAVILPKIRALKKRYLVVDFDPFVIQELKAHRVPYMYGYAGDSDFLTDIKAEKTQMVISSIPDQEISLGIVDYLVGKKFKGTIVVTVKTPEAAAHLYAAGATFVIVPSILGGERFGELLYKEKTDPKGWMKLSKPAPK